MGGLMNGILALALVGAEGGSESTGPDIAYQISVLEMGSIDWRAPIYHRLRPVARQGATTIWTVSEETARALSRRADKTLGTPKVTAAAGATATITADDTERHYVAAVGREANGPRHQASAVAFTQEIGTFREGFHADLSGRKAECGVLTRVSCEATWMAAMHTVPVTEQMVDEDGIEAGTTLSAQFQVPEVDSGRVEGEWLVPDGEVLVVSLGGRSTVDIGAIREAKGEANLAEAIRFQERLVLVDPEVLATEPAAPEAKAPAQPVSAKTFRINIPIGKLIAASVLEAAGEPPAAIKSMPEVPSRSLPVARAADGTEIPLPPLPDDQMEAASHEEASAEPRPTPQARHIRTESRVIGEFDAEDVVPYTSVLSCKFDNKLRADSPKLLALITADSAHSMGLKLANELTTQDTSVKLPIPPTIVDDLPYLALDEDGGVVPVPAPLPPGFVVSRAGAIVPAKETALVPTGTFRLPLGGGIAIEIKATVSADPRR